MDIPAMSIPAIAGSAVAPPVKWSAATIAIAAVAPSANVTALERCVKILI
jgi:hypothetical protein